MEAIKQVPSYAKLLKDLYMIKRHHNVQKKEFLMEQVNALFYSEMPLKYKVPECPVISYVIGQHNIEKALLDLRATVNVLPNLAYK